MHLLTEQPSDANSLHVKQADLAVSLGSLDGPHGNPYQNIEILVKAALDHKADAIHPGYGYLSEDAEFSRHVQEAKILFLGPAPNSMAVLGNKRSAKEYLAKHTPEVPLIPGYNGSQQSPAQLLKEADRIGYPVLIKASAGGGGKGMRVVHDRSRFSDELTRAQSEAQRSFGSSDCILEKYIQRSKHIEIQILGDSFGTVVSLLDRECSIQRRHQKVIEEAPSPWLSPVLRREMSEVAIQIGKLLRYESAGTVEFIVDVDTEKFYFLEVNTRIQVEHPITEEITRTDIVALQIYIASGGLLGDLDYFRDGIAPQVGHAVECRLCAEDPSRDFVPDLGTIHRWTPASETLPLSQTQNTRFETGIESGSRISIHFDSMIAKVVVWAPTRALAIAKMVKMMANTVCIGVRSNQAFLQSCLLHPRFQNPEYTTSFIPDLMPGLLKNPYVDSLSDTLQLLSFFPSLLEKQRRTPNNSARMGPFSSILYGFRNQKSDPASAQAEVVKIASLSNDPIIVSWSTNKSIDSPPAYQSVAMDPFSTGPAVSPVPDAEVKPSIQLARVFNKISNVVRELHTTSAKAPPPSHRVKLSVLKSSTSTQDPTSIWQLDDLMLDVDAQRFVVYTASKSSSGGEPRKTYAHIPALGAYQEFHLHSLLSFGESLRAKARGATSVADRNPKAPMPCKVLNVLKQNGELLRIGETGMVVESMKMEMNIVAAAEGTFTAMFQKGDAVNEGEVLFTIT
jgi:acetyl/propionyl-CoA carboxylase alpha subunit